MSPTHEHPLHHPSLKGSLDRSYSGSSELSDPGLGRCLWAAEAGEQSESTREPQINSQTVLVPHGWVSHNHCEIGQGAGGGRWVTGILVALAMEASVSTFKISSSEGYRSQPQAALLVRRSDSAAPLPPHMGHAALTRHTSVATSMLRQLNQLS